MKAWLLDGYTVPGAIRTWWIAEDGNRFSAQRPFSPTFFVSSKVRSELVPAGSESRAAEHPWEVVQTWCSQQRWAVELFHTQHMDLMSGEQRAVLAVRVVDPLAYAALVRILSGTCPWLELFQADLPVIQYAFNVWEWYPTMWCELELDHGWVMSARHLDERAEIDPVTPVLRFVSLKLDGRQVNPRHGHLGSVVASHWESSVPAVDGPPGASTELVLDGHDQDMYETLARLIHEHDPDVLLTDWGDDFLLPELVQAAHALRVKIDWNRDVESQVHIGQEHTYFSYGQVRHRAPIVTCFGRLHIDVKNSFLHTEGELDGLFELARLSSLPVQRLARTTIGTAMSAMQLLTAIRRKVLIPVDKRQPEDWKTAEQLIFSDKGGLVYQPTLGFHQDVLELDFASLYPAIMVRLNVSPETINCQCCRTDSQPKRVPEIGYQVCTKRRGLVSETLEIILNKRAEFKRRMHDPHTLPARRAAYDRRQNTLKWILVTCFGYLGFKNARFGRIEAHESVTAYGRELLLRAKEVAEQAGFRFLHGIVDSIWLYKPGVTQLEAEHLSQQIFAVTQIQMKIEGIYHWIAFLPSKEDPLMPVANRYFGLFRSGKYKVRGIELRRHDTPGLVLEFQQALLDSCAECKSISALVAHLPQALEILDDYLERLARGTVPMDFLSLNRRLSRDPKSYQQKTLTAVVAQELMGRGVELSPGEMVQYVITDSQSQVATTRARALAWIDADWTYDTAAYQLMLLRAFDSLFSLLGYSVTWLQARQIQALPRPPQLLPKVGPRQTSFF